MSAMVYSSPADPCAVAQPVVEHAVKAHRFVVVAIDRVLNLVLGVVVEVVGLAEHRADVAHLENQPLHRVVALAGVLRAGTCRFSPRDRTRIAPDSIMV